MERPNSAFEILQEMQRANTIASNIFSSPVVEMAQSLASMNSMAHIAQMENSLIQMARFSVAQKASNTLLSLAHVESSMDGFLQHQGLLSQVFANRFPDTLASWVQKQNSYDGGLLKSALLSHEIAKGISASSALMSSHTFPISKAFENAGRLADMLNYPVGFFNHMENMKRSRLLSELYESKNKALKIEYDFLKLLDANEDVDKKIITPTAVILQAKTIKKEIEGIYRDNSILYRIKPRRFEEVVQELFEKKGYQVTLTAQTKDGGYDLIALSTDNGMPLKYLVECKRYRQDRKIGIDIIRSFSDVVRGQNVNKGIIFTTSYFSSDARKHKAVPYLLDLKDHDDIVNWVDDYMLNR